MAEFEDSWRPWQEVLEGRLGNSGGGGRGAYGRVDGDLPVALRWAGPTGRTSNPATSAGGGRGKYSYVDGDLPVSARTDVPAQAVAHRCHSNQLVRRSFAGFGSAIPASSLAQRRDKLDGFPSDIVVMHVNIQGLRSHLAELCAAVRLCASPPAIICINETFLDDGVENIELEGFVVAGRRDRSYSGDIRRCGGIIVFVRTEIADNVTLLQTSRVSERLWVQMHTDNGPYLLGVWYRPPCPGEVQSIESFETELDELRGDSLGVLLMGDLNLHSKRWLIHSTSNSVEGELMRELCLRKGLWQMVREPTRGEYLLDLAVTDIESASVSVSSKIADHATLTARFNLTIPRTATQTRKVWSFAKADWDALNEELGSTDWSCLQQCNASRAAELTTSMILDMAAKHIPQRELRTTKRTHPWLTDDIVNLVAAKHAATSGTPEHEAAVQACSAAIMTEYNAYCAQARQMLVEARRGSKQWWSLSRELLSQQAKIQSIPALKSPSSCWTYDAHGKAELLAASLSSKSILPAPVANEYTELDSWPCRQKHLRDLTLKEVIGTLAALDESSGAGPDLLPARILKQCREHLALPILYLATLIVNSGEWPTGFKLHWIVPIFKRGAVFLPKNYRGVHLTAQISKVIERLLLGLMSTHITLWNLGGDNQFAYTKKRGSRDVLVLLTMRWVKTIDAGLKVLVYCSDVSGAFDRVSKGRLLAKLEAKGIHPKLVKLISSWLEPRQASVVVAGAKSMPFLIKNMVFQGTVLGPQLWNLFFEDARRAIREFFYEEMVYADDLNAYKVVPASTSMESAMKSLDNVQQELHRWGAANQVTFDPSKESRHVLSRSEPFGDDFKLLGVIFDSRLDMDAAVRTLAGKMRWKVKMLLRSRKSFSTEDLVTQYKQQVLSFIEYRTGAIYHATATVLRQLDGIQERFLRDLGITKEAALLDLNLAPLAMRRDIALLGVLHRAAIGEGPVQFREYFVRKEGSWRLHDHLENENASLLMRRSIWGLVRVYNTLAGALQCSSVKDLQMLLQERAKRVAAKQLLPEADWAQLYSPK